MTDKGVKELKKVSTNGEDQEWYLMVGLSMSEDEQSSLVQLLNQSSDVFAWTPHEMPGVDSGVATS